VRTTPQQRKKQYRIIYGLLWEKSRIPLRSIFKAVGSYMAKKRLQEAFGQQYIIGPDIRKRSYRNLKEYMYFANFENPERAYLKYREDERITYHAQMKGFCDLWIIAKEEIEIEGDIVLEGSRSDYYVSFAPDHSWEKALQIMQKKIERCELGTYESRGIIKTHWNETIEWNEKDESLYRYFKNDLRKPLGQAMKECKVSKDGLYNWLKRLPECCNINTHYYPETLSAYIHYLFMFETDYEDFIIDLFSELPASTSFFKVSNRLFARIYVPEQYVRDNDLQMAAEKWYLPLLTINLLEKGIVRDKKSAMLEYHWVKDF
jgi:hypothetical protein